MVTVVPYRPEWAGQFAVLHSGLTTALHGIDHTIEHVGSTAVVGLAAKPVLDVDVIVARGDVGAAIEALAALGYRHEGDLGIPGRDALHAPDDEPDRHVYVCEHDGLAVRNHLAARDVLRHDPDLREQYAALKVRLAQDPAITMDQYVAAKSVVLQRVLRAAGLGEEDLGVVRAQNQAWPAQDGAPRRPPGGRRARQAGPGRP